MSNPSKQIRAVLPSDADEWLRLRMGLWQDSEPAHESAEIKIYFEALSNQDTPFTVFVCPRLGVGLCGFVEVSIHTQAPGCTTNNIGYIEAWYVDEDCRKQGIGARLIHAAENWARAQGCTEMASDTDPSYPISPSAHAALGYTETQRFFKKGLA